MEKKNRVKFGGRTATAIIPSVDGKILLVKRGTVIFKGHWALPGGRVDRGESVEHAIIREIKEETGLDVTIIEKVGEYRETGVHDSISYDYYPACFLVKPVGGQLRRQEAEIDSIQFFRLDKLPRDLAFDHATMIHDYRRLVALQDLATEICKCQRCRLHLQRMNAVPGEGPVTANIMICGQAPGHTENHTGRPFVGMAGQLLNQLLTSINLDRATLFITSSIKCFPPKNRPPRADEVRACRTYLSQQIRLIHPKIIIALGNYALRTLLDPHLSISKVHGRPYKQGDLIIFPMFHPAAALRFPKIRTAIKADFLKLQGHLRSLRLHA
ncbi:MAG: NUDIX domain-containing protein [Candidatus Bathyarchaeota archaeon]|nr:MAG: NUDIX domain-containing protein [Candidatus Bathyarchaeota archaeon]